MEYKERRSGMLLFQSKILPDNTRMHNLSLLKHMQLTMIKKIIPFTLKRTA